MSEKGMIFTVESVRAILAGNKTQTRRVVKPVLCDCIKGNPVIMYGSAIFRHNTVNKETEKRRLNYKVGDIIYIKETWSAKSEVDGKTYYFYRADFGEHTHPISKWRSPRFMPKAAARIWLKVVGVRCERLQDISRADVRAEGFEGRQWLDRGDFMCDKVTCRKYCAAGWHFTPHVKGACFHGYWDNLNAKRGFGWDINPYVFVYIFEKIDRGERNECKLVFCGSIEFHSGVSVPRCSRQSYILPYRRPTPRYNAFRA